MHILRPPVVLLLWLASATIAGAEPHNDRLGKVHIKKVAAVVTEYRHNSHADIIISRLLQTDTLDGKGNDSPLELVALYTDQRPTSDTSRMLAASHRFPIYDTIAGALTLGTGKLAVDGVLIVGEHGDYPRSETGNTQYPKRRFFEETVDVFRKSGRVVPIFSDKHIADNWTDAKFIYDTTRELNIPMMAGSSLPTAWRKPAADVERGAPLKEILALTYGSTDHYGFHALEFVQALAEQRRGGETGIAAVQCFTDDAVWDAADRGVYDAELFQAAWDRLPRHTNGEVPLREAVAKPILFHIEYADGLVANVLELNGAVGEWSAAWRYADDDHIESAQFITQEARPGMHFTYLLWGVEDMMLSGQPSWPVERTLMTSGALDALLTSRLKGGVRLPTPQLTFAYDSDWRWQAPPPMPPGRPWPEQ
ncbi:MAG: hypothetical protein R3C10_17525 [Pirellulales bacterium]